MRVGRFAVSLYNPLTTAASLALAAEISSKLMVSRSHGSGGGARLFFHTLTVQVEDLGFFYPTLPYFFRENVFYPTFFYPTPADPRE